jgi:hypothetical protein
MASQSFLHRFKFTSGLPPVYRQASIATLRDDAVWDFKRKKPRLFRRANFLIKFAAILTQCGDEIRGEIHSAVID